MSSILHGIVKQGVIIPSDVLPEGTCVEIRICDPAASFTDEEQAEFDSWDRAGAGTIETIERLADEMEPVTASPT